MREEEDVMEKWGLEAQEEGEEGKEYGDLCGYPEDLNTWTS